MFNRARMKLTLWYVAITMVVSFTFSLTLYRMTAAEIERYARNQQYRMQRRWENLQFIPPYMRDRMIQPIIDLELIENAKKRIAMLLVLINAGILVFSGGLGYYLSGKTLQPIQSMLDEQKRFVSDASHEFRTPLTALKTAIEVHVRDKKMTLRQARRLLADNLSEVNKLQSLSDKLLELAEYESNSQTVTRIAQPFHTIISSVVKKLLPLAQKKNISIHSHIDKCHVYGNEEKLSSLVSIIIDNAIKYTKEKGKIAISLKKEKNTAVLIVSDTGIGIPKKDLPHIFDRFYRSDTARTKTSSGGFGLGLSIAKKIVESHHGRIVATSDVGKGTTVKITLPININNSL